MQKITSSETLRIAIAVIEQRQINEEKLFKEQFSVAYESLKPFNVIRKAVDDLFIPSELKDHLVDNIAGIISGYLSRILVVRNSKNPFLRLAGIMLQYGVTNIISKNSEAIRKMFISFIQRLLNQYRQTKE